MKTVDLPKKFDQFYKDSPEENKIWVILIHDFILEEIRLPNIEKVRKLIEDNSEIN